MACIVTCSLRRGTFSHHSSLNDAWAMREALRTPGAWLAGLIVTVAWRQSPCSDLYRLVPVLDRNLERFVMVASYLIICGVILSRFSAVSC